MNGKELDEVSRLIGRLEGKVEGQESILKDIVKQNGKILDKVNTFDKRCATTVQRFDDLSKSEIKARDIKYKAVDERLDELEEKDVLGGTSPVEKTGLWSTVIITIGLVAKAIIEAFA